MQNIKPENNAGGPRLPKFAQVAGLGDPASPAYLDGAFGQVTAGRTTQAARHIMVAQNALRAAWTTAWRRGEQLGQDPTRNEAARTIAAARQAKRARDTAMKAAAEAEVGALEAYKVAHDKLQAELTPPSHAGRAALLSEIRGHLRGLSVKERNRAITEGGPDVLAAVVTAPPFLSGLVGETHARLRGDFLKAQAPQAFAEAEELEDALKGLERTRKGVAEHFSDGFDFASLAAFDAAGGEADAA